MKKTGLILLIAALVFTLGACDLFSPPATPDSPASPNPPVPPPVQYDKPVALYLPNDNADGFVVYAAMTDGSAEHIVSLLVDKDALPAGCELLDFSVSGNSASADMNAKYGQAVSSTGTAGEYMMIGSVVNTLLTFFELEEITLTIEGQVLETGHSIYDFPLRFFENQTNDSGGGSGSQGTNESYDTYDLSGAIADLPRNEAVIAVWDRLGGYWNATDNLFVGFILTDDSPGIEYGLWETEYGARGKLIDAKATDKYAAALTFFFPAVEANEMNDGSPETTSIINIDVSGLIQDGKINIKIENLGSGGWYTYAYGGATAEDAYKSR
jgi:hypothetical protein